MMMETLLMAGETMIDQVLENHARSCWPSYALTTSIYLPVILLNIHGSHITMV